MKLLSSLTVLAVATAPFPALAARDPGLSHQSTALRHNRVGGVGLEAGLTLKLGDRRAVRPAERLRIGVAAGPSVAARTSSLAGLSINPGRSATFTLAGQPVARHLTRLGADEEGRDEKKDGKGPSTLGWAAIGVGALVVAGGVTFALMLADAADCSDGECE